MEKNIIYLINPSEEGILEHAGDRVPIGLISIAGNLRKHGFKPKVFDLNHQGREEVIQQAYRERPRAIGISAYTSCMYDRAVDLAENLEETEARLIAGGYHATFMPETLTDYFDAVVQGEGEDAMIEALDQDGIIKASRVNLATIPPLDFRFIDLRKYGIGKKQATMITSRGCPYSCSFCGNMEHQVRYNTLDDIFNQFEQIDRAGFESVYFLDDVFTMNMERMRSVLSGLNMPFRVTTRANLLNPAKLDELADSGCEWLSMGIESGNDDILLNSRKGMTTLDNYIAVREAYRRGIKTKGFFIIGLPGETEQTAMQTIDFSKRLRDVGLTTADFYYLMPFPGTPIFRNPERFGLKIVDNNWRNYLQAGKNAKPVVETEKLKLSKIEELVTKARELWK
jgi:radical SAM superfamily enzyme YgiQ (UPF0313 family)